MYQGKAAQEAIRALIESVIVTPAGETMMVDLVGEFDGILSIASGQKVKGPAPSGEPSPAKLVAGTRIGRDRHSLVVAI
jgi:hypothetical protein